MSPKVDANGFTDQRLNDYLSLCSTVLLTVVYTNSDTNLISTDPSVYFPLSKPYLIKEIESTQANTNIIGHLYSD